MKRMAEKWAAAARQMLAEYAEVKRQTAWEKMEAAAKRQAAGWTAERNRKEKTAGQAAERSRKQQTEGWAAATKQAAKGTGKRRLAWVLALCMLMQAAAGFLAWEWVPTAGVVYAAETEEEWIPIYTAEDLRNIENNMSGNYILMNDIDLAGINWEPIGGKYGEKMFSGSLDGNGHEIKNLTISITSNITSNNKNISYLYVGLFGGIDKGFIKNLTFSNVNIEVSNNVNEGWARVGTLTGYFNSHVYGYDNIVNCTVRNGEIDVQCPNMIVEVGGFIGHESYGTHISRCCSGANITATAKSLLMGGIVGYGSCKISYCINTGTLRGNPNSACEVREVKIGGIEGEASIGGGDEIQFCANYGSIIGDAYNIVVVDRKGLGGYQGAFAGCHLGGILGGVSIDNILNCYNAGDIIGSARAVQTVKYSGWIGWATATIGVGGIVGMGGYTLGNIDDHAYLGKISNCYNVGSLSATAEAQATTKDQTEYLNIGGITGGYPSQNNPENCYYSNSDLPGLGALKYDTVTDTCVQLTPAAMQQQSSFAGFDFENVWQMGSGSYPYPVLRGLEVPDLSDSASSSLSNSGSPSHTAADSEIEVRFENGGWAFYSDGAKMDPAMLTAYWKSQNVADTLASYGFAVTFADDLDEWTKIGHSFANFTQAFGAMAAGLWDVVTGKSNNYIDAVTEAYMNDTAANKAVLKDILEERFDNASTIKASTAEKWILKGSDELTGYLKDTFGSKIENYWSDVMSGRRKPETTDWTSLISANEVKNSAELVNNVLGTVSSAISIGGDLEQLFTDYAQNTAYLEAIRSAFSEGSAMRKAVDELLNEYETKNAASLFDIGMEIMSTVDGWQEYLTGIERFSFSVPSDGTLSEMALKLADKLAGTGFGTAQSLMDMTLGKLDSVSAADKIVDSVWLRTNAITALRRAGQALQDGNVTAEEVERYVNLFELARSLTVVQYENMKQYYESGAYNRSDRAQKVDFLAGELEKLDELSPAAGYAERKAGMFGEAMTCPVTEDSGIWKSDSRGWWIGYGDGTFMKNHWYQDPKTFLWYYMGADGYMLKDQWLQDPGSGSWYYLGADGAMLTNAYTPDGCYVGQDGVWRQ